MTERLNWVAHANKHFNSKTISKEERQARAYNAFKHHRGYPVISDDRSGLQGNPGVIGNQICQGNIVTSGLPCDHIRVTLWSVMTDPGYRVTRVWSQPNMWQHCHIGFTLWSHPGYPVITTECQQCHIGFTLRSHPGYPVISDLKVSN